MNKILYIIVLVLALDNYIYSQDLKVGFTTGIGTYSMSGLKTINKAITESLPFDTQVVSGFPLYLYYQPKVVMKFADFSFGLVYTFQSTGSRISGKDYSGEYRFDMKVNSNNPGIYAEINILSKNNYKFSIYSNGGFVFTNLKMNEYFNLQDTLLTDASTKFKALNYYFEPGINATYSLSPVLSLALNAGYFIQFGSKGFYKESNKDYILTDPSNQKTINPDWNGIRVGISAYYAFHKKVK
jgi:hypothetical protein